MRIAFLVPTRYDQGGTASAVTTQAAALVRRPEVTSVTVVSVYRTTEQPHFALSPQVARHDLVDTRDDGDGGDGGPVGSPVAEHPDRMALPEWDPTLDARGDLAVQRFLPTLEADVLVTVTPALLSLAARCRPDGVRLVHQEHRSSSQRTSGLEPLLRFSPQADLVAVLTEPMAHWLRDTLAGRGAGVPRVAVVPNAVPPGFRPRSLRDAPLIVAAGRLAGEKQYPQLVEAFALVADRLPGWRLRIFGEGPSRPELVRTVRRLGLHDRVELPGSTTDLAAEWARASISAMTSRSEGFPLVMQEAMAAGVPVVSYDCPSGPRAIVDDGADGLLVPQDSPAALAEGLLRLAGDAGLRHRLGEAALTTAAGFDSAAVTEQWCDLYDGLVTGSAPPPQAVRSQDEAPPGVGAPDVGPAEVPGVCLAAATAAARAAGVPLEVVGADAVRLPAGVWRDWLDALAALPADVLPPWLSLLDPGGRGWPARRGTVADLAPRVRRGCPPRLRLEPWPRGVGGLLDPSSGQGLTVQVGHPAVPSGP